MVTLTHRFQPPRKTNHQGWKTAQFLVQNGFPYQHIYDDDIIPTYVPYPKTMNAAKEFVIKYQPQKLKNN